MNETRKGLTMVEALVVLFCIGMLVLLMLPQVRSSGISAQRYNCSNQMRQLLLGCLNRESATQRLPSAMAGQVAANRIDTHSPSPMANDDGYSFIVPLLAYVEETELSDAIYAASNDLSEPINSENFALDDGHLFDRAVELVVCPSFPGENLAQGRYAGTKPQVSNYHAMVASCAKGDDQAFADADPKTGGAIVTKQAAGDGLKLMDITDGSSMTIMLTESREEKWAAWFSGASASTIAFSPEVARCADFLDASRGFSHIPIGLNYGSSDNSLNFWNRGKEKRAWGPSAAHAGDVVMSGFVDGHVKPLNAGIGPRVYFQMSTRGGGEEPELE